MATITITFGDCAENHVGMQMLGTASPGAALSYNDLLMVKGKFETLGLTCEMIDLSLPSEPAFVLVIRGGVSVLLNGFTADQMFQEHAALDHDKRALMYKKVVNKVARWNLCFSDFSQEPDYESGKGRVISFGFIPITNNMRMLIPHLFGESRARLQAEGNYYYDPSACGIGYHGDTERSVVIAVRLGVSMPLCFRWYHKNEPVTDKVTIILNHGDVYAMSAKAVGFDWKSSSKYTLRHAAGCDKYVN